MSTSTRGRERGHASKATGGHREVLPACIFLRGFFTAQFSKMDDFGSCLRAILSRQFLKCAAEQFRTLPFSSGHGLLPVSLMLSCSFFGIETLSLWSDMTFVPVGELGSGLVTMRSGESVLSGAGLPLERHLSWARKIVRGLSQGRLYSHSGEGKLLPARGRSGGVRVIVAPSLLSQLEWTPFSCQVLPLYN